MNASIKNLILKHLQTFELLHKVIDKRKKQKTTKMCKISYRKFIHSSDIFEKSQIELFKKEQVEESIDILGIFVISTVIEASRLLIVNFLWRKNWVSFISLLVSEIFTAENWDDTFCIDIWSSFIYSLLFPRFQLSFFYKI